MVGFRRRLPRLPKEKSSNRVKCKKQGCPFLAGSSGYCQKHKSKR